MDFLDDKVPITHCDDVVQKGTIIGETNAYALIWGDTPDGLDGLLFEGPYYCCELGCHIIHPYLLKQGDRFVMCGTGPDGTVFATLNQSQASCMIGLDKFGRCVCNHRVPLKF